MYKVLFHICFGWSFDLSITNSTEYLYLIELDSPFA